MNHDELRQLIEEDELRDGIEAGALELMAVRDYAKARGIRPQLLYYYLRKGKLTPEHCPCGRLCLKVTDADEFFSTKNKTLEDEYSQEE
jgi:hypothetical protein